MDKPVFTYVTDIATTPEQLWEALTSGDFTYQYWGGRRIESAWKPGSPVKHVREDGGTDWQGEVLEADPPKRLSYTFMGHVKLTVTHDHFEPGSHPPWGQPGMAGDPVEPQEPARGREGPLPRPAVRLMDPSSAINLVDPS